MDVKTLGEQVFVYRRKLGLSQGKLADLAEISRNYVSLIERGEAQNVSLNIVNQLAAALGVAPAELTGEMLHEHTLIHPALRDFGLQAGLSFEVVDRLARIPRRGQEPQSAEEWEMLFNAVREYLE
ncbi:MAG: helix-turn-helix transcriptional regulator [Chloroflexi bacterium]|nr:helix-turn-helix transcriptional regulator [Chloroflexota bacterium]